MLRSATLVCTLLLVGGVRVVRDASTSNDDTLKKRINPTLRALDTDWKNATTAGFGLLNDIAGINWRGDIGDQMKGIARRTGLRAAHFIVSAAHPLLGVVFSLMSSLFGWGGAEECNMVEQILEEVKHMIKDAVNALRVGLVTDEVRSAMATINDADTNVTTWSRIPSMFSGKFNKVFTRSCWDSPAGDTCRKWRRMDGGAKALLLEIKFTELMVLSGATLLRYGTTFKAFAESIDQAARRTRGHYNVYEGCRLSFASADCGVTKGNVTCGGRIPNVSCGTNPSYDNLLKEDFCTRSRVSCSDGLAACKTRVEGYLNTCHSNYLGGIRNNLQNKIKREVEAIERVARSLKRGEEEVRKR